MTGAEDALVRALAAAFRGTPFTSHLAALRARHDPALAAALTTCGDTRQTGRTVGYLLGAVAGRVVEQGIGPRIALRKSKLSRGTRRWHVTAIAAHEPAHAPDDEPSDEDLLI